MVARRRTERGNALTLAVLIVLAMIGLGMLAIRSTRQNLAGSGNLRTNKQARYIADLALHEAITFMNQTGNAVFANRPTGVGARIVLRSDGGAVYLDRNGAEVGAAAQWNRAELLQDRANRPGALGQFAQGSGLRGSFEVTVDGFRTGTPPPGNSPPGANAPWTYCQMEFTARGIISDEDAPTAADLNDDEAVSRFAEYTLRAGVVLRVSNKDRCGT